MFTNYRDGAKDDDVIDDFKRSGYWGIETLINLKGCDKDIIKSADSIKRFIIEVCDVIDMERHGEPVLERFGNGHLYGYSVMQLITTSSIVAHFSESTGEVYIDLFSCRDFSPSVAAKFAAEFFKADGVEFTTILRK